MGLIRRASRGLLVGTATVASAFALSVLAASASASNTHAKTTTTTTATGTGVLTASKPLQYVALGDSYTSGVGTLKYYSWSGDCLRSPDAYPELVTKKYGYKLHFAACSGATAKTLLGLQLGSLNKSTNIVTIQIGGNDAGFGTVLDACLGGTATECAAAIKAADTFIAKGLPKLLNFTYSTVRARAQKAGIVVVGYPRMFATAGTTCASLPMLTKQLELALNATANDLDTMIAKVAKLHHFTFVDPRAAFASHEECSSKPYLTGLLEYSESIASFHPNIAGEAAFAKLVEKALR